MLPIKKFTIGVRPANKMFRVQSQWGDVADAVFAHVRRDKTFEKDYFTQVSTSQVRDTVTLLNKDNGNQLVITMEDIVFFKDLVATGKGFDRRKALAEFEEIWKVVNSVLHVTGVRRIGIVAEARIEDVKDPSSELLSKLTGLDATHHPAKFNLRYEQRFPTSEGLAPDVAKDDFENVIYTMYDAIGDTEHPTEDALSLSLDFQRYYAPTISKDIIREVQRHAPKLEQKWESFCAKLEESGIGTR